MSSGKVSELERELEAARAKIAALERELATERRRGAEYREAARQGLRRIQEDLAAATDAGRLRELLAIEMERSIRRLFYIGELRHAVAVLLAKFDRRLCNTREQAMAIRKARDVLRKKPDRDFEESLRQRRRTNEHRA